MILKRAHRQRWLLSTHLTSIKTRSHIAFVHLILLGVVNYSRQRSGPISLLISSIRISVRWYASFPQFHLVAKMTKQSKMHTAESLEIFSLWFSHLLFCYKRYDNAMKLVIIYFVVIHLRINVQIDKRIDFRLNANDISLAHKNGNQLLTLGS